LQHAALPFAPVTKLTDYTSYADAQKHWSPDRLWELFDGSRERLNIAHECIDRHVDGSRTAVILAHADGRDEALSFADISRESSQFAHYLAAQGVKAGDRVAVMLEPSRPFYVSIFGALKLGAIAVPLFTLFGPDGIRLRVTDCSPKLLITNAEKASMAEGIPGARSLSPATISCGRSRATPPLSNRPPAATITRSTNTLPAPRANCPRR
jgi:acetyl-CoA synthetase